MRNLLFFIIFSLFIAACGSDDSVSPELAALLADQPANRYDKPGVTPPDGGCTRLRINGIGGTLGRVFNDSNYLHLEAARAGGIEPVIDLESLWQQSRGIVKVHSDSNIYIDSLTHSYPFLTRHAADLLYEIGRRFRDSLDARGGGDYRLKVTSVLRTPQTVRKLRRLNRNATQESAHQYATTFDISHSKFICDNADGTRRTFEDLKNLLAEIVYDLRREGRCYVKHERKQACLHITSIADTTTIRQ